MSADEFRRRGRAMIDWIADYLETVGERRVLSEVQPGQVRAALPKRPPVTGESFDAMLRDIEDVVMPGLTHWQHPGFFAFFPANTSGPAILGELLAAGLGVQGMLWQTSPACTEVETHVLDWLVGMLGLPETFLSSGKGGGVIQDTASSASLCALLAARERATDWTVNQSGAGTRRMTAYTSVEAHSSVEKAMMIAGLGRQFLRLIPVDGQQGMDVSALRAAIEADRRAGCIPFFVGATVGTTASNGMDPVRPIGELCRRRDIWLHVDAAMSGTAALCPEFRHLQDGVELADSYCFNPHKWMFTNFDCDAFYVADRAALIRTLSILPEYLKNDATLAGDVFDYRDWHVPLGRRFRALKLWFVIRHYGVEGLRERVREHVGLTQDFAAWVREQPHLELLKDPPLNLVCFSHRDGDAATEALHRTLNESGRVYLSHARVDGRYVIRMSIGGTNTTEESIGWVKEIVSVGIGS